MLELNKIYCMDNIEGMRLLDDGCIDLTVTSPPYSDLRDYKEYSWDFESLAQELFRITKNGGGIVWVVGDKTKNGSEELTPFKQALYFREIGFNVWDTMIYQKTSPYPANVRYQQDFEFMFVFSKGKMNTFNPVQEPKSEKELKKILNNGINFKSKTYTNKDGTKRKLDEGGLSRYEVSSKKTEKNKSNIWKINAGYMVGSKDKISFDHPATFPEQLAQDHILSWSNENDIILDPFMGSGTTAKMAKLLNRKYIGFDISQEYCNISEERLANIK